MVIIGAKGFAKEILLILEQLEINQISFYDDVSFDLPEFLYQKYPILKSLDEFQIGSEFVLGIGGTILRKELAEKFMNKGGYLKSIVSPNSIIGNYNIIENGVSIMANVVITNDCQIGEGTLINLNATIGHDTIVGKYCDIMPGSNISGNCTIGNFCALGTNCTILPKVKIGNNVTVGAGSVVTKDVPDDFTVVGVPAKPFVK